MNMFNDLFDMNEKDEELLINILKKCDEEYFNNDSFYNLSVEELTNIKNILNLDISNEVNDDIYDELYFKIKSLYPLNSYFNKIGANVKSGKIKLDIPMGSANELKRGDWDKWRVNCDYVVSNKLDGCSCRLYYENGKLVKAMSRGNGYEGQDITRHVLNIPNIKRTLGINIDIKIRGEIIVPKSNIQQMLDSIEEETGKRPKNQRNSVSGFLNSKNGIKAVSDNVEFIAYKIEEWDKSEYEMFKYLDHELEFKTSPYKLISSNTSEEYLIEMLKDVKQNYECECDGLIITQNITQPGYEGYETNSIKRKSSRKFKVGTEENNAITEVVDVLWGISKDGLFKPRVKIKPVELVGVTIEYATGNNYKNIIDNHIGIGSHIRIHRAGDVIPFISEIIKPCSDDIQNYNLPDSRLWYNDSVDIRLVDNVEDEDLIDVFQTYKTEQNIQKLIYFCSCLEIDQAKEGNIRKIVESSNNTNQYLYKDLINEPKETFIENIGINGNIFYNSLHQKLANCNVCKFFDAVNCFGRGIGETKLEKVYNKYQTLNVSIDQLLNTQGFASKSSEQYFDHLSSYFEWMDWLEENNIQLVKPEIIKGELENLVVCFTGVRDPSIEQFIKMRGGRIASSVTKDCKKLKISKLKLLIMMRHVGDFVNEYRKRNN